MTFTQKTLLCNQKCLSSFQLNLEKLDLIFVFTLDSILNICLVLNFNLGQKE